jgi:hypothetical protein
MHQVIPFNRCVKCASESNGAGIVHEDINATEQPNGLGNCGFYAFLVANVDNKRECLAASRFNSGSRRINRTLETRVRVGGLCGNDDVRAVACSSEGVVKLSRPQRKGGRKSIRQTA